MIRMETKQNDILFKYLQCFFSDRNELRLCKIAASCEQDSKKFESKYIISFLTYSAMTNQLMPTKVKTIQR